MRVGVVYPQTELQGDPLGIDRIARAAEALNYDHLLLYDHVVGAARVERNPPLWERGPYTDQHPFHDPLVAFGYVAGITKRIDLVTGVLILPQRQTVLVAKQATDVDLLSGGRLHLGVGSGWNYVEYDSLGQDFATRGPRLTEQISYLRKLWSEPVLSFKGQFDRMDRANILPRPRRRIPIYCGGFAEPAYARAAKLADGFIFASSVDHALAGLARVRELLAAEGRSADGFRFQYIVQTDRAAGLVAPKARESIERWRDAGGTHASIVTMGLGFTTIEQHLDHLNDLQRSVAGL
jgi:probable F420-dependent oxidoreductase